MLGVARLINFAHGEFFMVGACVLVRLLGLIARGGQVLPTRWSLR
jgi:branched-subunit amino acid ABC-type transport system permease component